MEKKTTTATNPRPYCSCALRGHNRIKEAITDPIDRYGIKIFPIPNKPYGFYGRKATCLLLLLKIKEKRRILMDRKQSFARFLSLPVIIDAESRKNTPVLSSTILCPASVSVTSYL